MKSIGILGGMGPGATVAFFNKIVMLTDAKTDQEHIRIYIDNNVSVPDRTKAILEGTTDPVEQLQESAKKLEQMGADIIVMPCNTAHYFYDDIIEAIHVPMLNMIKLVSDHVKEMRLKKVCLLATTGTLQTEIYDKSLASTGVEVLKVDDALQQEVMDVIYYAVKGGNLDYDASKLAMGLNELVDQGVEKFVLGCTELPIAFESLDALKDFSVIESTDLLARAAIEAAGAKIKL